MMQSYSPIAPHTQSSIFRFILMAPNSQNKTEATARKTNLLPPPSAPYVISLQFEDRPCDVLSSSYKPTIRFNIPVGGTSNALFRVTRLFNTCAGANIINESFLQQAWKESILSTRSMQLQTANCEVGNILVIVQFLICILVFAILRYPNAGTPQNEFSRSPFHSSVNQRL